MSNIGFYIITCYEKNTFFSMAKHYQTGETIPKHYYDKLITNIREGVGKLFQNQIY